MLRKDEGSIVYSTEDLEKEREKERDEELSDMGLMKNEEGSWEIKPWLL